MEDPDPCVSLFTNCKEPYSWLGLPFFRAMYHMFFRLESMAPGAHCDFQFLTDQCHLLGSEAFRPLCVSLYAPFVVKEA